MRVSPAALRERIRGEYLEMPGLSLTLEQMQRLGAVERTLCQSVLDVLVEERFLCIKSNGTYVRSADGEMLHSRGAKARPQN